MKIPKTYKEALMPVFIFALGIFIVSGLSYITTVFANPPENAYPPQKNAFKPINTSDQIQGRCEAINKYEAIDPRYMYDKDKGCKGKSTLITNGLVVTGKKTTFLISGDPKATDDKYKPGALYVGCSIDTDKFPKTITDNCIKNSAPEAYFNGDIYIHELADPSAPPERELCLSTTGEVVAGKPLCSDI